MNRIFTFEDIKQSVEVGLNAGGVDTFWLDEEEKKKREEEARKYRMQLIEEAKKKATEKPKEQELSSWNPISEENQKALDEAERQNNSINWRDWAHGLSSGYSSVDQAMNPVFDSVGNTLAEGVQRVGQGLRWVDEVTGTRELMENRNPELKEAWERRDEFLDETIDEWQSEEKNWNISQVPENAGKGVLRAGIEAMQASQSALNASASFLTQPFLDEDGEKRFSESLENNENAEGLRRAKEWTMPDEDAGILGSFANYTAEWIPAGGLGSSFGKGIVKLAEKMPKVGKGITGLSESTKTLSEETIGVLASTPAYVAIKRQGDENEMSFWEEVKNELIFDVLGTGIFHFGGRGVKKIFEDKGIDSITASRIADEIEPQMKAEIESIRKGASEIPELKEFGEKRVLSQNDFEQMRGNFLERRRTGKYTSEKKEKRGIYNTAFNDKKSTPITETDIDLKKGNRKFGARHIIKKHLGEGKNGEITTQEFLELGSVIRKGREEKISDTRKIFTSIDTDGRNIRAVVDDLNGKETVISFYKSDKKKPLGGNHNAPHSGNQKAFSSEYSIQGKIDDVKKVFAESETPNTPQQGKNNLSSPLLGKLQKQREEKISKTPEENRVKHDVKQGVKQEELQNGKQTTGKKTGEVDEMSVQEYRKERMDLAEKNAIQKTKEGKYENKNIALTREKVLAENDIRVFKENKDIRGVDGYKNPETGKAFTKVDKEFLKSKTLKFRAMADDKEIFIRKLEEVEGIQKAEGESFYEAEQLMHGRIDTRSDEALEEALQIAQKIRERGQGKTGGYTAMENEVNEYLFAQHITTQNLLPDSPLRKKEFDESVSAAAQEVLEYQRKTNEYLVREGVYSDFVAQQKESEMASVAYGVDKKGKATVVDALENAVFNRQRAIQTVEKNRVKQNIFTLWDKNKGENADRGVLKQFFEEVESTDIDKYLAKQSESIVELKRLSESQRDWKKIIEKMAKEKKQKEAKVLELESIKNDEARAKYSKKVEVLKKEIDVLQQRIDAPRSTDVALKEVKAKYEKQLETLQAKERMEIERIQEEFAGDMFLREEVNEFLIAQHALERNRVHKKDMVGMSVERAKEIVSQIKKSKSKRAKKIKNISKKIVEAQKNTLKYLYDKGLVDLETKIKMEKIYKNHIPLRREFSEMTNDGEVNIHSTKKDDSDPLLYAYGSDEKIKDILDNVVYFRERAVKLDVQKRMNGDTEAVIRDGEIAFYEAKLADIEKAIEKADAEYTDWNSKQGERKTEAKRELNAEQTKARNQFIQNIENAKRKKTEIASEIAYQKEARQNAIQRAKESIKFFTARFDGKMRVLEVKDEVMFKSLNSAFLDDVPMWMEANNIFTKTLKVAHKTTTGGTNLLGRLATTYNLAFGVGNKVRDTESAAFNSFVDGVSAKDVLKNAGKSMTTEMNTVIQFQVGKKTKETDLYKQFLEDGGTTGGFSGNLTREMHKHWRNMEAMKNGSAVEQGKHLHRKVGKFLENINEVFENSTRFNAYKQALSDGKSRHLAALAAKNLTVNFNKHGYIGKYVSQYFLFANAAVQGTKIFWKRSVKDGKINPRFLYAAGAVFALYQVAGQWNDMIDPEWRESVSPWERKHNLIIMLPDWDGDEDFSGLKIPMSLEFGAISGFSYTAQDVFSGKSDFTDIVNNTGGAIMNTVDIMGNETWAQKFTPTLFTPFVALKQNIGYNGMNIEKDFDGKKKFESYYPSLSGSTTGRAMIGTSDFLYNTFGWDTSPYMWKYLAEQYTSGTGRTVMQITNIAVPDGKETPTKDIPFLNRFKIDIPKEELEDVRKWNRKLKEEEKKKGMFGFLGIGEWKWWETKEGGVIVRVLDGDTVEIMLDNGRLENVRMKGVDTPESVRTGTDRGTGFLFQVEDGALESSSFTKKELSIGEEITFVDHGRDKYDRALGVIEVQGGENFSEILVREGMARVYDYENEGGEWFEKLQKLDEMAEEQENGLWNDGSNEKGEVMDAEELKKYMRKIVEQEQQEQNIESLSAEEKEKVMKRMEQRKKLEQIEKLSAAIAKGQEGKTPTDVLEMNRAELKGLLDEWDGEELEIDYIPYKKKLWAQWYAENEGMPVSKEEKKVFSTFWKEQFGESPSASQRRRVARIAWENDLRKSGRSKSEVFEEVIEGRSAVEAVKALRKMRRENLLRVNKKDPNHKDIDDYEKMLEVLQKKYPSIQEEQVRKAVFMSVKEAKEMGWE